MIRRSSRSSRSANLPRADASVDVVISNCVINLSADKYKVLAEAAGCCGRAAASPYRT